MEWSQGNMKHKACWWKNCWWSPPLIWGHLSPDFCQQSHQVITVRKHGFQCKLKEHYLEKRANSSVQCPSAALEPTTVTPQPLQFPTGQQDKLKLDLKNKRSSQDSQDSWFSRDRKCLSSRKNMNSLSEGAGTNCTPHMPCTFSNFCHYYLKNIKDKTRQWGHFADKKWTQTQAIWMAYKIYHICYSDSFIKSTYFMANILNKMILLLILSLSPNKICCRATTWSLLISVFAMTYRNLHTCCFSLMEFIL